MRIGNYINPKFTEWTGIETTFYKGYPYVNKSSEDDKFFPAAAVELKVNQSTYIQCSQSLTGLTIVKVYGEDSNGRGVGPNQLTLDAVNDRIYNNYTLDLLIARVDLSDGTKLVYMGGLDTDNAFVIDNNMRDSNAVSGNDATIVGTFSYVTQKQYNHLIDYGASQNKILNIQNSTEISQPNDTATYVRFEMQDFNGNNYSIGGFPNADPLLDTKYDAVNNRIQIADSNTASVYGFVQLNDRFDKGDIKISTSEYFANGTYTLSFSVRDDSRLENFKSYMLTNHSVVVSDNITGQQLLYCLDKSQGNNYPNDVLLWTGVTCDDVIAALGTVITDVPLYTSLLTTKIAATPSFGIVGRLLQLIYTNNSILGEFTLDSDTIKANAFDEIGYFSPNISDKDNVFQTYRFATVRVDYSSATQVTIYVNEFTINDNELVPSLVTSSVDSRYGDPLDYPVGFFKREKQYTLETGNWIASREHRANSGVSGMYVKVNSITYSTTSTKDERLNVPFYLATVSTVDINWSWQSSGNSEIYNLLLEGPYNNSQEPSPYNNNIYITNSLTNGDVFSYNDNIPSQWGFQISPTLNYGGFGFKWTGSATFSQLIAGKVRYTEPFLWESDDVWTLNHVNNYLEWKDINTNGYNVNYFALTQSEGEIYYGELSWNENEYTLEVKDNFNRNLISRSLIVKQSNVVNYIINYNNKLIANSNQKFNDKQYNIPTDMKIFLDPSNKYSYSGSGTTWYDISANDNDFTANGNVSHNGLSTIYDDSVDSYLSGPTITFTDVSISFFFKITGNPNNNANLLYVQGTVLEFISLNRLSLVNGKYTYRLQYAFEESTTFDYGDTTLVQDRWYNLTLVYDNTTTTLKFYLNDVVDMTSTPRSDYRDGTGTLRIGYNPDYSLQRGYNGEMGIFMYFDRVLTESEISNIYNLYKDKYIK